MASYRGIADSARSAEETFDYMAEFSNAAEWDPGVERAERIDDGPVGLGSTFRLAVKVGGRTTPLDYTIVSYQRPHRVVVVAENAAIRSEDTMTVVARPGGGSILTYDAELGLRGVLAPLSGLLGFSFRRIGDRGLGGLRRVLSVGPATDAEPDADRGIDAGTEPGPGSTDPGPIALAADELLEASVVGSFSSIGPAVRSRLSGWRTPPPMTDRVVLITGATSGLGLATAIGVARLGATVRFVARSGDRAQQAVDTIAGAAPGADLGFLLADMGELDQVRAAAAAFRDDHGRLDVLVHNAGALSKEYTTTAAGTETTVASQLVGPFLLTGLLLPALQAAVPSRVIQMSSGGMYTQRFDLDDLEMGPSDYDGTVAYARVKRAQLVLMHEWVRRLGGSGVVFHGMHPGWADTPGIRAGLPGFARVMGPLLRSAEEGADTAVWLAASSEAAATSGGFWLDRRPRWEHKVPWTHLDHRQFVQAGSDLWAWCAERAGWDGAPAA